MGADEFDEFIKNCREEFRWHINGYINGSRELKDILKRMFGECCSEFEEETLKEHLQEEFKLYMEGVTKGA